MMLILKKYWPLFFVVIFFISIFFISINPDLDTDIWFHLKSGEIIAQQGIIHHDVFSYRTEGREWFPYEWLFQIIVYYISKFFGMDKIMYLMAFSTAIMVGFIYLILRKIFQLNLILSCFCSFFFLASIYEFIGKRPVNLAYTFLAIHLFIIYLYYFKSKNWLILTLPITLAWANMHGSSFLAVFFFLGYTITSLINYFILKQRQWLTKFKNLGIFTILCAILTVLPPLGFLQYRLLWIFFQKRWVITNFIDEWTPLSTNPGLFIVYSGVLITILCLFLSLVIRQKLAKKILWVLPLLPLPLSAYTASRNVFLGYISLALMLGFSFSRLQNIRFHLILKSIFFLIVITLTGIGIWLIPQKRAPLRLFFPIQAAQFIKQYDLAGNMFNEYGFGGYLLYHLYPQKKVFIDGRTDLYLCCEMAELLDIAGKKNLPDDQYKKFLDDMFDKYQTSYVLLRTQKHQVLRKMARILTDDPNWNLIYWDDGQQIIVRKDGKNNQILQKFETLASTPYNRNPYREGMEDQALMEYQRMIEVSDSARSRNAIGFLLLSQKKYEEAKSEFEKALKLDPEFESPYMNLAELSYKDGDLAQAMTLYKRAQKLAPDRGLIYIRLGQIYLQATGDKIGARKVYEFGVKETVDDDAKVKLKQLVSEL